MLITTIDQQVVEMLAGLLGISYDTAESSVIVLVVLFSLKVIIGLINLLKSKETQDVQQNNIQEKLIELLSNSLLSQQKTADAIEANSAVLRTNSDNSQKIADILQSVSGSLDAFAAELKVVGGKITVLSEQVEKNPTLDEIKGNLLKTSKTPIVIKNSSGEIIATLVIEPDNETGELVIRVGDTKVTVEVKDEQG